ncbi:hypothetical protein HXX76_014405 [Chlamydomonas incerta]|uniref:Cytoplasmic tRNA 2-thiolation protein 2 n=1 Tax=Chlamydomonas incerta TaxID=51695 RepID=A0A835SCN7_CHLIN|nr:hypothetical protein HXX76_014405 [Chlamydomonas incerta]|eukprot:KAG2424524.1 hypothetical protein HXX76_014405 [Chlamydomonas incerta]
MCHACLELNVNGKVRALKTHKLLLPGDNIAIALSGGSCSLTLLSQVLPMRKDASTPRKERGKIPFGLTVIHINDASAHGATATEAEAHGRAVVATAQQCAAIAAALTAAENGGGVGSSSTGATSASGIAISPGLDVWVVPLRDVFLLGDTRALRREAVHSWRQQRQDKPAAAADEASMPGGEERRDAGVGTGAAGTSDGAEREARLQQLLQAVQDPTGREDLIQHLRRRLLAAAGAMAGATKLLCGDSATALAARVIADTAKGRGFALPSDIQLVDARGAGAGEPTFLYPMREVTVKEAVFVCRLRGLRPAELPGPLLLARLAAASSGRHSHDPRRSINNLASTFIDSLQANLPSTIFTVLRTSSALRPFSFNSPDAMPATCSAVTACGQPIDVKAPHWGSTDGGSVASGAGAAAGSRVGAVACCLLCRAPLSARELRAIAAAAASSSVAEGTKKAGAGSVEVAEVEAGAEADEDEDDAAAPFCESCRGQILFRPGHHEARGGEEAAGGGAGDGRARSLVQGLLPEALVA